MSAKSRPFSFSDFRRVAETSDDAAATVDRSADAMADMRAAGILEGRRLAMESIAASEAEALARIGDALAACAKASTDEISEVRNDLVNLTRLFLQEFCATVAIRHEAEIAEDLLSRLMANSDDRRKARLIVSEKSLDRLRRPLEETIRLRGLADVITLCGDAGMRAGETRLEWRGGGARRGRAEIRDAIEAMFDAISPQPTEPNHERA